MRVILYTPKSNCLLGLIPGGLEDPALVLGALGEGDAQLEQLQGNGGEVLEEQVVVLGVLLDPGAEGLVLGQDNVGGQHHQSLGGLVLVLQTKLANRVPTRF